MKSGVCILGSTGSIGRQTLDVIKLHADKYQVVALSAYSSADDLFAQCCEFNPEYAVLVHKDGAKKLRSQISEAGLKTIVLDGQESLVTIAELPQVQKVVAGIVGAAGLSSTLAAAKAGKQILLANKEALIMSGELLLSMVKQNGAQLLPVDSEHNALFQCMPTGYTTGTQPEGVERLILTASGGPFLHTALAEFSHITPEMACQHPTWKMGKKITVDCATLMNKGLEVIEASLLFQLPPEQIDVVIHPQSTIHSLVSFVDGSVLAQLGTPDMRTPITHCLSWPSRIVSQTKRLNLVEIGQLTFFAPDHDKFRCLPLAFQAINLGKAAPTVLNASNEIAVAAFLNQQMNFSRIPSIIEDVLQKFYDLSAATLDDILWADQCARAHTLELIGG